MDEFNLDNAKGYIIGIDIGSKNTDFCLIDESAFYNKCYNEMELLSKVANNSIVRILTPPISSDKKSVELNFYKSIAAQLEKIFKYAAQNNYIPIRGIGIGLPGMVDPKTQTLIASPSWGMNNELYTNFASKLEKVINWDNFKNIVTNNIVIDNDVRCATRYIWKIKTNAKNLMCIFIGNGVGSGIVINNNLYYGHSFLAGEIGHVLISKTYPYDPTFKCHCGGKGGHWEMFTTSYGMLNMARNINPIKYKQLINDFAISQELTTDDIKIAAESGNEYAQKLIDKFIDYVNIGLSNYLSIMDFEKIFLGGGMIRAFYPPISKEIRNIKEYTYTLNNQQNRKDFIIEEKETKQAIACIGAALIMHDQSYFDYINS